MSTPTEGNAFLHELELDIRTDLTLAEASQPEERADVPITEWQPDTQEQRYEVSLRNLLGAVEAMEDPARPASPVPASPLVAHPFGPADLTEDRHDGSDLNSCSVLPAPTPGRPQQHRR